MLTVVLDPQTRVPGEVFAVILPRVAAVVARWLTAPGGSAPVDADSSVPCRPCVERRRGAGTGCSEAADCRNRGHRTDRPSGAPDEVDSHTVSPDNPA